MEELYWVLPEILAGRCGPAARPWELAALWDAGVRGIVSLDESDVDAAALSAAKIEHLPAYLPMTLLLSERERERFLSALPDIFEFVDRIRRQAGATLVHCHYGLDRTGAVLACYLVARQRLGAVQAIEHVRALRPDALLAPGYAESVQLFEQKQMAAKRKRPPRP